MKRTNPRIIGIKEGDETQVKDTKIIFHKIIREDSLTREENAY